MNYFKENGHLEKVAFEALVEGSAEELASLEIAEHLSFCDECLFAYTNRLSDDVLLSPQKPVMHGLKIPTPKRKRLSNRRYATVAASLILAAGVWSTTFFATPFSAQSLQSASQRQETNIGVYLNGLVINIDAALNEFFSFSKSKTEKEKKSDESKANNSDESEASEQKKDSVNKK